MIGPSIRPRASQSRSVHRMRQSAAENQQQQQQQQPTPAMESGEAKRLAVICSETTKANNQQQQQESQQQQVKRRAAASSPSRSASRCKRKQAAPLERQSSSSLATTATSLVVLTQQQQQDLKQEKSAGQIVCAACCKPIRERYLLEALDKQWHEDCLKCACCDCRLGEVGSSLFTQADKILCRRDFLRIFGQAGSCAACKKSIPPYELVMRANENAYHMECFACQQCQYRFCVGDRFHLTAAHRIVCTLCHGESAPTPAAAAAATILPQSQAQVCSSTSQSSNSDEPTAVVV